MYGKNNVIFDRPCAARPKILNRRKGKENINPTSTVRKLSLTRTSGS